MKRTRIKICGVTDTKSAWSAVDAGADAVGLVFVEGSPRQVDVDRARQIVAMLPAFVEPIGLFVNDEAQRVREISRELGLHTIQLHGQETPEQVASLSPLRVIKAFAFEPREVSSALSPWRGSCDNLAAIMFDAPPPDSRAAHAGGSGRTFDWSALAALEHAGMLADLGPMILAGGLTPDNVADAIRTLSPYAVDVSSGVESERGVKDPAMVASFCHAAQQEDIRRAQGMNR